MSKPDYVPSKLRPIDRPNIVQDVVEHIWVPESSSFFLQFLIGRKVCAAVQFVCTWYLSVI